MTDVSIIYSIISSARACIDGGTVLEGDEQIDFSGLLDWHVGRLLALENPTDIGADQAIGIGKIGSVAHQAAGRDELAQKVNSGNRMTRCQGDELVAPTDKEGIGTD